MENLSANELRIGNYVLFNDKTKKVDLSDFGIEWTGDLGRTIFKEFKPIALTEEWLIAFGFEEGTGCFTFSLENGVIYYEEGLIEVCLGKYSEGEFYCNHIKYVHQIQNLLFSLTGEELKLAIDSAQV